MRFVAPLLCLVGLCFSTVPASAQSVVERVKARGVLSCGGVARPGLAENDGTGWHGLEIDIGRAVAAAVLGSPDRVEFHAYATDADFAAGAKTDDLLFLTGAEIAAHSLAGRLVPGPTVFVESQGVLVPGDSDIQRLPDLKDRTVCFYIGSPSEGALNAFSHVTGWKVFRRPFSEVGEMVDAYAVRNCEALVGEITDLAAIRNEDNVRHLASRILTQTLENYPVVAATATTDAPWASLVAWTIATLVSGERQKTPWFAGGADAMPADAPELGLPKGWQSVVLRAVGNYGDLFDRNLGAGSLLHLERGVPENRLEPGLLLAPYVE
jgi:general L-amino acid transport system substrate-binding protein